MATWVKRRVGKWSYNYRRCKYVLEANKMTSGYTVTVHCKQPALYYLHHRYYGEGLPRWLCEEHYRYYKPLTDGEVIANLRKMQK